MNFEKHFHTNHFQSENIWQNVSTACCVSQWEGSSQTRIEKHFSRQKIKDFRGIRVNLTRYMKYEPDKIYWSFLIPSLK